MLKTSVLQEIGLYFKKESINLNKKVWRLCEKSMNFCEVYLVVKWEMMTKYSCFHFCACYTYNINGDGEGSRMMKRRDFFTRGFPAYVFKMGEAFVETAGLTEEEKKGYFDSFESCYPLLSEVSYDMMLQAAGQLGIVTEGKNKITLAREIYAIKGGGGF